MAVSLYVPMYVDMYCDVIGNVILNYLPVCTQTHTYTERLCEHEIYDYHYVFSD
jgi:hypothetical protein